MINNIFGDQATFDHVGIAVQSIDAVAPGATKFNDPIQKVTVAFVEINHLNVELIEPADKFSPVTNILKKRQSLYHLSFKVEDMQDAIKRAQDNGFTLLSQPVPAVAYDNKNIAWVFSRSYGLIELIEA